MSVFSSIQGLLELDSDAAGDKNYADIDSVDEVDSDDGMGDLVSSNYGSTLNSWCYNMAL